MNKAIRVIGSIVLAILSMNIPVFFGVSIVAHWNPYYILFLGIGTIGELCLLSLYIYFEAEEE